MLMKEIKSCKAQTNALSKRMPAIRRDGNGSDVQTTKFDPINNQI